MPIRDLKCVTCGLIEKDVFFKSTAEYDFTCKACGCKQYNTIMPKFNFKVKDGTPQFHGGKE